MNPMTNVRNIEKLNEEVLRQGITDELTWHRQYKDSAWVFIGGLPYDLTEGDILCVFSQYGEIVDINLVKEKKTGKTKGFCFLCYEDQRSTVLSVDNLNGIKLGGRTIRVDHCDNYRRPKSDELDEDGQKKEIISKGCAPQSPPSSEPEPDSPPVKRKKEKKTKKRKEAQKRKDYKDQSDSDSEDDARMKRREERPEKHVPREENKYAQRKTNRDFEDSHKQRGYKTNERREEKGMREDERYHYESNDRYSKMERKERRSDDRDCDTRGTQERGEKRSYNYDDRDSKYSRKEGDRYSRKEHRRSLMGDCSNLYTPITVVVPSAGRSFIFDSQEEGLTPQHLRLDFSESLYRFFGASMEHLPSEIWP